MWQHVYIYETLYIAGWCSWTFHYSRFAPKNITGAEPKNVYSMLIVFRVRPLNVSEFNRTFFDRNVREIIATAVRSQAYRVLLSERNFSFMSFEALLRLPRLQ